MRELRVDDIDKRVSVALSILSKASRTRIDYLVVDAADRVVASSDPDFIGSLSPEAREMGSIWQGDPSAAGPLDWTAAPSPVLIMSEPVYDPDDEHRRIGTLVGLYDWNRLTDFARSVQRELADRGVQTAVLVVERGGSIVGGSESSLPGETVESGEWADAAELSADAQPSYLVLDEAGYLVARAPIGGEFPHWRLLIVEALSDALRPSRDLTTRLVLLLGLTLLLALVLAAFAGNRVVRPLTELTVAIRDLTPDALSALRVPVRSEDEVGTLATTLNRMAQKIDQAQQDVINAAKFALVGEVAAGVAHEVRTSLGVLRSSAQLLKRSIPPDMDAEAAELAQLIREEVDRLGNIVDELLEIGRPRALHLEPTPLWQPLARAIDFVEPQAAEKGISISQPPRGDGPVVSCDREVLYQVVLNLLVNAVQALQDGGHIYVAVLGSTATHATFEVQDDGPGVPDGLLEDIFHPFATATTGGMGLGLAFVQRMIYEHHGRIRVESEAGVGTRFRIDLPLAVSSA